MASIYKFQITRIGDRRRRPSGRARTRPARGGSLDGFYYHTSFAPGKGPFHTGFGGGDGFAGDPAIPMSPHAILAGIGNASQVNEPATGGLMLAGLDALLARRRAGRRA